MIKRTCILFGIVILATFSFGSLANIQTVGGTWIVSVEGIPDGETRTLIIAYAYGSAGTVELDAKYGFSSKGKTPVKATLVQDRSPRQLVVVTQAASTITMDESTDGSFVGKFITKGGKSYPVRVVRVAEAQLAEPLTAGNSQAPVKIMMINMGGADCPPCVAWRRFDLPKLQAERAFQSIEFVHVEKTVYSAVPPEIFLPDAVKPFKQKLDKASGGMSGSPQVAILVNGEVYDYIWGARSADEVLKMIQSIQTSTPYPFERCLQRRDRLQCQVKASQ